MKDDRNTTHLIDIASAAVGDMTKLTAEIYRIYGNEGVEEFNKYFLTIYLGASIRHSLNHPVGLDKASTKEEQYKITRLSYQREKARIQDAVASAFNEAVNDPSSNEPMDFICQVWLPKQTSKSKN